MPARDSATGVTHVRLSNRSTTSGGLLSYGYTGLYGTPKNWSLSLSTYGGSTVNGIRGVYVQWRDGAGNWSSVRSDTIVLDTVAPSSRAPAQSFPGNWTLGTSAVPVALSWSGTDATSGIGRYQLMRQLDGGAWTNVPLATPTTRAVIQGLYPGHTYRFSVRAIDRAGNVGAWAAGPSFRLNGYQETSSAVSYGGTWTRQYDATAYGRYVRYARAAGARARITFTARNVAWVAPRSASRGQARVYVDGAYVGTVSLYSSYGQPRRIVFTRSWASLSTHTVEVRVVGTAGHPRVDVDAFVMTGTARFPAAPPPPPPPPPPSNCDPSYPGVCIPPPPPDLDCPDVWRIYGLRNFRVVPPDPHRFDADRDGIGCET